MEKTIRNPGSIPDINALLEITLIMDELSEGERYRVMVWLAHYYSNKKED